MNKGQRLCKVDGVNLETQIAIGGLQTRRRFPCTCVCDVCGKAHPTWECCQACNYGDHRCHFCGEDLNHDETLLDGTPNPCYLPCKTCDGTGIGGRFPEGACRACNGTGVQG